MFGVNVRRLSFAVIIGALVVGVVAQAAQSGVLAEPPQTRHWQRPTWLVPAAPGMGRTRLLPATRRSRTASVFGSTQPGWKVDYLPIPAGLSNPMPYAINRHGDIAIQFCPSFGCLDGWTGSWYPYVYEAKTKRLIGLPRFGKYVVERYYPFALDDSGRIVGMVQLWNGTTFITVPVLWTRTHCGVWTISLLLRPGVQGEADGINDRNVIVGTVYGEVIGGDQAVEFTVHGPKLLGPREWSDAYAINFAGVAVGDISALPAIFNGPNGTLVPGLPNYGGASVAINRSGNVVGSYLGTGMYGQAVELGFFYSAATGQSQTISLSDTTYILAVNDNDEFVGVASSQSGSPVGPFIGSPVSGSGSFLLDLPPPAVYFSPETATGINNCNQIVGQAGGLNTVFILQPTTPIPHCAQP